MCVSPFSVNWDCRMASWGNTAAGFPNQCSFPMQQLGPSASDMFGQCQFTNVSRSQLAMADEVLAVAAAKANNMPVKNNVVQVGWLAMPEHMFLLLLWFKTVCTSCRCIAGVASNRRGLAAWTISCFLLMHNERGWLLVGPGTSIDGMSHNRSNTWSETRRRE